MKGTRARSATSGERLTELLEDEDDKVIIFTIDDEDDYDDDNSSSDDDDDGAYLPTSLKLTSKQEFIHIGRHPSTASVSLKGDHCHNIAAAKPKEQQASDQEHLPSHSTELDKSAVQSQIEMEQPFPSSVPLSTTVEEDNVEKAMHREPRWAWRVGVLLGLGLCTTAVILWLICHFVANDQATVLEICMLVLLAPSVTWASLTFWTSFTGFLFYVMHRDPIDFTKEKEFFKEDNGTIFNITQMSAIVMMISNDRDTNRIMAGMASCVQSLKGTNYFDHFDFFLLSATDDTVIAEAEITAWNDLVCYVGSRASNRMFYLQRQQQKGEKGISENLKEFVELYGSGYHSMIVLNSKSVMTANSILQLTEQMQQSPDVGLIQTIPMPIRQTTVFGRVVQFSKHMCSPAYALGSAFWMTNCANAWRANSIIRMSAFVENCGLPNTLPGSKPMGGEIIWPGLIQAALMFRAGWKVKLATHTGGSYEDAPSSAIDFMARDGQHILGSIQHLAMLFKRGFRFQSKLHFWIGACPYLASLCIFAAFLIGTIAALLKHFVIPFEDEWAFDQEGALLVFILLGFSSLALPRFIGYFLALIYHQNNYGGCLQLTCSFLLELLLVVVMAPTLVAFRSWLVVSLISRNVRWKYETCHGTILSWKECWKHTWCLAFFSIALVAIMWHVGLGPWFVPITFGSIFVAPLIRCSSSQSIGRCLKGIGVFGIQEERNTPPEVQEVDSFLEWFRSSHDEDDVDYVRNDDAHRLPSVRTKLFMKTNPLFVRMKQASSFDMTTLRTLKTISSSRSSPDDLETTGSCSSSPQVAVAQRPTFVKKPPSEPTPAFDRFNASNRSIISTTTYSSEAEDPIGLRFTEDVSESTLKSTNSNTDDLFSRVRTYFLGDSEIESDTSSLADLSLD